MAALPLNDDYPVRRAPVVAYALIAANVLVYLASPQAATAVWYSPEAVERFCAIQDYFMRWGAVPAELTGTTGLASPIVAECGQIESKTVWFSLLSSMFVHGGAAHLLGNMVYLFVFGPVVEDRIGRLRFLALYLATGLVAALGQTLSDLSGEVPKIGRASCRERVERSGGARGGRKESRGDEGEHKAQ